MAGLPIAFPCEYLAEVCIGVTVVLVLLALLWEIDD